MKKIFFTGILAAATLSLLISCGGDNTKISDVNDAESNGGGGEIAAADKTGEAAEERLYPDLEARDFGGYEFTFLTRTITNENWTDWDHRDIFAEEANGDVINDAVYGRNRKIESKYNINIKEITVEQGVFTSNITKSVRAEDDVYDAVCIHLIGELATLASDGSLTDLFKMPHIGLDMPWWNQNCVRDLSIGHKLFVIQGDLLILDNDALEAMIFNKTLIKDYGLESPYDIVKRGEWTFDKLLEMSKGIARDLNGDGAMYFADDLFGATVQADTAASFLVSGGEKIAGKDENDYPALTFGSEKCYRILEIVSEINMNSNEYVNTHRHNSQHKVHDILTNMMSENRVLFSWIRMRVAEAMRAIETDFGIIPCPKSDKSQEKYITRNNPHTSAGVSIPVTASDPERTGMILEDLCAESKYTLQPAYYEINLRGKFVRDDDSQEMLDIILSNTAYDIGAIYDFGGFLDTLLHYGRDQKTDYASAFERVKGRMESDIEKIIAAFGNLG